MKKTLFLGTALMIGAVGFAQSGAKKAKDVNPKYLQKAVNFKKIAADSKPTPGTPVTPTIAKLRPSSVQGGINSCGLEEFTTSYNAFGVGGGSTTSSQNCLSYNTDLNTLVWTQRGSKTWSLNSGSGFLQATTINAATLATDSIIMYKGITNPGRYPSGTIVNPLGNTDIHNAYAISFGQALDAGGTNWVGTAYTVKSLSVTSVVNHTAPTTVDAYEDSGTGQLFGNCIGSDLLGAPSQDLTYLPDGKTFITAGSIQNADVTAGDAVGDHSAVRGAIFVKGVINSGTTTWTIDTTSMIPDVHTGTLGYQLGEPRIAFGPDGMTGYVVMLARMATNYNNYSDSSMTPIVYKTMDGGTTWTLQQCLLGYDWMGMHPEVEQNVGELSGNKRGYTFDFYGQGSDVTVDKDNKLHLVTCVTDYEYTTATGLDSLGIYSHLYDYDYVDYHPIIWDFMTDGSGWNTMMVDSVIASSLSSSSSDTTNASTPMGGSQTLGVHAHIQVSRSLDGSKIFYGWADSDPNVVGTNIYGQALNTNPDIMMKAWDLTSNMVSSTKNTTAANPYTGSCFYPYLSDISYNDGTNWVVPAVFTVGHIVVSNGNGYNVYDASSQADYHYSNCGTFSAADFVNTPNVVVGGCTFGISKTKTFDASITNYPNPFNSTTTIAVNLSEAKSFSINVYNTIGALVYSKTVNGNVGTNNVSFDGSSLNAGVYYYTVNAGNQQTTKKMVIAK